MNPWNQVIIQPLLDARFTALFLDALMKSFVVLALAAGICALWRRASAATRHLIWFLALISLPCLPLLTTLRPAGQGTLWSVSTSDNSGNQISLGLEFAPGNKPVGFAPHSQDSPAAGENKINPGKKTSDNHQPFTAHFAANWLAFGLGIWGAGVAAVLGSLGIGQIRLRGFRRRAQRLEAADWLASLAAAREILRLRRAVVLLQSADNAMPLTWGWWHPVVLLPVEAESWPVERRRMVLLHELAHVKRCDCLTQLVAKGVCAFFWFNPLAWLAARQMCIERERACDDLVLNGGCKASDYAGLLVEIAGRFRRVPQSAAIAMARSSGLEQRVEAILDSRRNRSRMAKMTAAGLVVSVFALGLLIGGCQTVGLQKSWSLENSKVAPQLKAFVADKQAQEATLVQADEKDFAKYYPKPDATLVRPDCRPFFAAAAEGNWPLVNNLWSELENHTLGLSKVTNGYPHGMWLQPVRETYGALEAFAGGSGKYAEIFGDEILQSIPPGSVYFGGTDPGRFVITALQKSQVAGDPFFTLTQNALADGTYLDYLRSMYAGKIYIPTQEDAQKCFQDYTEDVTRRQQNNQLKPGEHVKIEQGRVQISGATAVMQINGLLVKTIFDRITNRDFFIEQSFPLDWMYPYLEPHGLIFKLNRQPLPELSDEIVQRDHDYWTKAIKPLIGDWLNDDTSVQEIAGFAKRVFRQHNFSGFTGDPQFVQNSYSSKIFSKERANLADLYIWRMNHSKTADEKERMAREADFAYRQALALCPDDSEAVKGYADFLKGENRLSDATLVTETAAQLPSGSESKSATSGKPATESAKTSGFQMRLVLDTPAPDGEKLSQVMEQPDGGFKVNWLEVEKTVLLDQTAIYSARATKDALGHWIIDLTFSDAGRKKFAEITRQNIGRRLAIILDGQVRSAPVIQTEVTGGKAEITGVFSEQETKNLAAEINAAIAK